MKLAVLGAGAWGTALAVTFSSRHVVALWARDAQQCMAMRSTRVNRRYLPDIALPDTLAITSDLGEALAGKEAAIVAVTTNGLRDTLRALVAQGNPPPLIWVCKGFEAGSCRLAHQVADEELPASLPRGVLSGPSFADEVARDIPAAVTLAATDSEFAARMARELHSMRLRVYSTDDVVGVEVGGAVKNVIAIGAGISDGLAFGESARAALVTRGLAEITRLGLRLAGRLETFMGLSGVGDLILTCTGSLSRNRRVGLRLAAGQQLPDILRELGHVAEGVHSAREVSRLAGSLSVDMPIVSAVCRVLYDGLGPQAAVDELLSRDPKREYRS
ncbi:MAG TPA: NAD(P)H-dependent glycerol-3-phosphate dehydrogenase [Burkholderiales bacterium]|nr:NAD(P)H-dependent glycerol-3-phosphate dehydrogenase [Burkholderiales bacterium]